MRSIVKIGIVALTLATISTATWAEDIIKVFKSPWCGCCTAWSEHLRENGFHVTEIKRDDMEAVKRMLGVPERLSSCHTAIVDGYVVEGHVPAQDIKRLLSERPDARGLTVPGMPVGSPGMEQEGRQDAYDVVLFGDKGLQVYQSY